MLRTRAGFTLPDLMIGMALLGLIATVAIHLLLGTARTLHGERERASLEAAFDAALGYVSVELAGLAPADLQGISRDSTEFRGIRTTGLACLVEGGEVRLLTESLSGTRQPQPGRDSLLLYLGTPPGSGQPAWITSPILTASAGTCAGRPALRLGTILDTALIARAPLPVLAPAATFERMQVRLYQSLGTTWFGVRSVSAGETVQPLAGPFLGPGSGFIFLDSAGNPTLAVGAVRHVELTLAGVSPGWEGSPGSHAASATLRLTPANLQP